MPHELLLSDQCLYAAAWDAEVKQALLPRTICGRHAVMYRRADGEVAALEDACWHRLVPLSKGRLEGDSVVCGYHGLKFNAQGRCTFMPSQETINPSACVRAYSAVERNRFICCGWAIWRWLTQIWCRTCTGTTILLGSLMVRPFTSNATIVWSSTISWT